MGTIKTVKMKLLTGRAEQDFLKWLENNYDESELFGGAVGWDNCYTSIYQLFEQENFPEILQCAIITEWLDSVDIRTFIRATVGKAPYIFGTELQVDTTDAAITHGGIPNFHETRAEAINSVISKANEIYNSKNQ